MIVAVRLASRPATTRTASPRSFRAFAVANIQRTSELVASHMVIVQGHLPILFPGCGASICSIDIKVIAPRRRAALKRTCAPGCN